MSGFSVLPTIDGYDVIDNATGHPVDHRETLRSANGVAYALNGATLASHGSHGAHGSQDAPGAPGGYGGLVNGWGTARPYEHTTQGFLPSDLRDAARRERSVDY